MTIEQKAEDIVKQMERQTRTEEIETIAQLLRELETWRNGADNMARLYEDAKRRIAELEAQLASSRKVINRVGAQVGHPPIARGEVGIESVAEAVERHVAHSRERQEALDSITPESLQAFAASEAHHDEHHEREKELEAQLAAANAESGNARFVMDKRGDAVELLRARLASAKDACFNLGAELAMLTNAMSARKVEGVWASFNKMEEMLRESA